MDKIQVTKQTIGWAFPVFVILLICKVTGLANIGWLWVFFPLWIGPVILLSFFAFLGVIGLIAILLALLAALLGK